MNYFEIKKRQVTPEEVIEVMGSLLTDERKKRIEDVVNRRTYDVVPVLESIYDRGNISAVIRSAEAFGLQNFHIVETSEKFKEANRTTTGADKWLNITKWQSSVDCAKALKASGHQIICTHLEASVPISEVDFSKPTALVLGNEKDGVSKEMLALADQNVIIPMQGFAQSFNISVAGAICFYHIYQDRLRRLGYHGNLTPEQKKYLIADFYLRSADNPQIYFKQ